MVMTCVFALQNPAAAQADAGSGQATPAQGLRPLSELRGTLEEFGLSYQLGLTGLIQSASETAADRDTLGGGGGVYPIREMYSNSSMGVVV